MRSLTRLGLAAVLTAALLGLLVLVRAPAEERRLRARKPTLRVFIAVNVHNSQAIVPNMEQQLLWLADVLGPGNVFVSVFENGSTDGTKPLLRQMADTLARRGIPQRVLTDNAPKHFGRRVPYLARARNRALEPLREATPGAYDRLVFLNDIVFTANDVLRLLLTADGEYDAACGMDYFSEFYDTFATRDRLGRPFGSGYFPYADEAEAQASFWWHAPVPVFSCWNGLVAFAAAPFAGADGVRFRALAPTSGASMDVPQRDEASECCLVFADLMHATPARLRTFINPTVKVAYDWQSYYVHRYLMPWLEPFFWLFNRPSAAAYLDRVRARKGAGGPAAGASALLTAHDEDAFCIQ